MAGLRQKELLFAYRESAREGIMLCGETNKNDAIWWRSGGLGAFTSDHKRGGVGNISVRQTTHEEGREGKERQKGRKSPDYLTEIEFQNSCDDMWWRVRQIGMVSTIFKCLRRLKQLSVK